MYNLHNRFYSNPEWDSGLHIEVVESKLVVRVPAKILDVCASIQEKITTEFLVAVKATIGKEVVVGSDFYIPRQKATVASVNVEENISGWNAVIHSHPQGMQSFSIVDIESINANNDLSILYEGGSFRVATIRLQKDGLVVLCKTTNIQVVLDRNVLDVDVSNIQQVGYRSCYLHGSEDMFYF